MLWWFSNAVVLGGSLMYARVRQLEMAATRLQEPKVEDKGEELKQQQKVVLRTFVFNCPFGSFGVFHFRQVCDFTLFFRNYVSL